ncbi:hypothetical protein GQX73_g621 [Xylaria multiplex]|uniref:non-specific serine/threonine protein kinase n=1 Tax=Xylaria multiplex TaxID=323545 RepID=A0A7C8N0U8_9PEZI|nr:hypothetical protein GQX73_g621 [Xylaria multiplex]
MIDDESRYFSPGGSLTPGGPSKWNILDWDQRRIIAVTMDEEQYSEDVAVEHLKKHIDTLGSDVYAIHISPEDGSLISVSTDPKDDETTCVYHPPLQEMQRPDWVKTVLRSELRELDRLSPNVDLVSYTPPPPSFEATKKPRRKVIFKYYFLPQFIHKLWNEMNLWMRLPLHHPNLVPFDRLVLDELNGSVVGFTNLYVLGGTLDENKSRVFKLKYLKQLTHVVDDLNLEYGIMHQDIAARNLLINRETDALMLFDFNYSGRIGGIGHEQNRDDVGGVIFTLYEIITQDEHFREIPHDQQNPANVEGLDEWVQHADVELDHDVSEYRSVLKEWVKKRREGRQIAIYTEASQYIDWPILTRSHQNEIILPDGQGGSTPVPGVSWFEMRRDKERGSVVLNWERPPQNELRTRTHVLANGKPEDEKPESGNLEKGKLEGRKLEDEKQEHGKLEA